MRILVVTNMYPPHSYGGYEASCRDVVERWRRSGHEVLVLTSNILVAGADSSTESRSEVMRDLQLYWEDHLIVRPPPLRRLRWELANRSGLDHTLASFEPDVASVWAMGAMSMGLLSRLGERSIPVVNVICDEWPVYGPHVDAWLGMFARRRRAGNVVHALTRLPTQLPPLDRLGPSCFISESLRATVSRNSPWRFAGSGIVYSGIDASRFNFRDTDRPPWRWRLLYVGRIDPRKGVDVVIKALASCPEDATLSIDGRGDSRYLEELKSLAENLGVASRVVFSQSERNDLARTYREADVVVFPPTWEEPFGLVPLEAMACGAPVVASPTGGSTEFLVDALESQSRQGNCLAFHPGDVSGLTDALFRLSKDPELRTRLVAAGLATAAELDVDHLAEVLARWHHYAASDGGVGRPEDRQIGRNISYS